MEVFSLSGHSGTGKSHQSPLLARKYGIEYIIDDGLLIKGNLSLAGRSAKRENTRFGAVKRALFKDPEHAAQVREKLNDIKPDRILILGTSHRMAEMIAQNLGLPEPQYHFTIEEVSDPESIKTALTVRAKENRHVIPLPTFAIKKEFPGYIIDPLRSFFSLPAAHSGDVPVERSVVRPIFSSLGSFFIAEHVINDLISYVVQQVPGVHRILHFDLGNDSSKVILNVNLSISLPDTPEMRIDLLLKEVQQRLKKEIEYQTGFYLDEVRVCARKLHLSKKARREKELLRGENFSDLSSS
jgi:uncharacterized alkaline shock family protein YloU